MSVLSPLLPLTGEYILFAPNYLSDSCTAKYHYLALHTDKMTVRVSAGLECPTATQKRRVSNWLDAALFHGEMVARSFVDHCHGVRMQTYADSMHLGSRRMCVSIR